MLRFFLLTSLQWVFTKDITNQRLYHLREADPTITAWAAGSTQQPHYHPADCSQLSSRSPGFQDNGLVCSSLDTFISAVQPKDDTKSHKCLLEMRIASRSRRRNIQAKQLALLADYKCTEDTKHQSCKSSGKIFPTLTFILLQSNIWKEMVEVSWLRQLHLTCWIKL